MNTDLSLLSRYHRHGDAEAFAELVRDHAGMVFATARRVTGDAVLAEDVAQETFLELARSGRGIVESVPAWLHRVASRKACNSIRSESRRRRNEQLAADLRHDHAEAGWEELEPHIDKALDELPAALRGPLVQHFLEGRTQQEIAAQMGVSQSTVSRQLDAAVMEMRATLRRRGVICGTGLAAMFSAHSANAAPASLTASLGKITISGVGAGGSMTPSVLVPSFFTAMTTTTKVILITAAFAAVIIPLTLHRPTAKEEARKPDQPTAKGNTAIPKPPLENEPRHYRPTPVSREISQKVDGILDRFKGLSKAELAKNAELNSLEAKFQQVILKPDIAPQIMQRMKDVMQAVGKRGTLTMDSEMLKNASGRAWLEAVVSDDADRMKEWVLHTLDGAIFEFAVDPTIDQTTEGVKVIPPSQKPAVAP